MKPPHADPSFRQPPAALPLPAHGERAGVRGQLPLPAHGERAGVRGDLPLPHAERAGASGTSLGRRWFLAVAIRSAG